MDQHFVILPTETPLRETTALVFPKKKKSDHHFGQQS